jgi:hypothetical protein
MITDDMIRANLERVARERSGSRSILGFPVIERDWGLIDDDETRRIEAESNQRAIDASRAELREILNGRH